MHDRQASIHRRSTVGAVMRGTRRAVVGTALAALTAPLVAAAKPLELGIDPAGTREARGLIRSLR
jgi:hypothetical protein